MVIQLKKIRLSINVVFVAFAIALLSISASVLPLAAVSSPSCNPDTTICVSSDLLSIDSTFAAIPAPTIASPAWLKPHVTFTYNVQTRGTITADVNEFKTLVNQTLNDSRGWSRLNLQFTEVPSGGNLTIYLAESSQMTSFSATGCSTSWSCTVGNTVIINQDRWLNASDSWNKAGGSLRDYRNMVVNHETGHWLGHSHLTCGGPGQPAPVMQQQSIDLMGCTFNPWPLDSELWSSRL